MKHDTSDWAWRAGGLACAALAALAIALSATSTSEDGTPAHLDRAADLWAADLIAQWRRSPRPAALPEDPVIIGIDDATREGLPEPEALWHRHYGALIDALAGAQAAALGVMVPLPDRLYGQLVPGIDEALLGPIRNARGKLPLVFGVNAIAGATLRAAHPAYAAAVAEGGHRFANATHTLDADGLVRRLVDPDCAERAERCGFANALAAARSGVRSPGGYIRWDIGENLGHVSLRDVLHWVDQGDHSRLRQTFSGRIVLLGPVLRGEDRVRIPVVLADREPASTLAPAVMVHAQVLRGVLGGGFARPAEGWQVVVLALAALPCALGSGLLRRALAAFAFAVAMAGLSAYAASRQIVLPVVSLALAGAACALIGLVAETLAEFVRLSRLQHAFEGSLEPRLVHAIESGETELGTGAARRAVAVLLCRLGEVGERAAKAPLAEVGLLMDAQLARIEKAVRVHGGEVESFAGDTLLARFGDPLPIRQRPRAALEAAQDILAALDRLREELAAEPVRVPPATIGVATGVALVGRLGVPGRGEPHVLGPIIDEARRLEALAGTLGVPILCSDAVAAAAGHPAALRAVDLPGGAHAFTWGDDAAAAPAGVAP